MNTRELKRNYRANMSVIKSANTECGIETDKNAFEHFFSELESEENYSNEVTLNILLFQKSHIINQERANEEVSQQFQYTAA